MIYPRVTHPRWPLTFQESFGAEDSVGEGAVSLVT